MKSKIWKTLKQLFCLHTKVWKVDIKGGTLEYRCGICDQLIRVERY